MRLLLIPLFALLVLVSTASRPAAGQGASAPPTSAPAARPALPRMPDGRPDLQGIWDFRTVTPMERPPEFAGKAVLSAEEAAAYERRMVDARNADANRDKQTVRAIVNGAPATEDVAFAYNDFWWDRGTTVVGSRRTSLVVDPADGRIPPLTPEGRTRLESQDAERERPARGPEDRPLGERCILGFNSGPPMVPAAYNMNMQVIQAPGYVVIMNEMVHNARIVPLDNRPHGSVRQWVGTSRGRWDGDTLVVETKNFSGETAFRGSSPNLHLIERFTLADPRTLLYEFTVDDPTTWTRSWTAQLPMRKTDGLIFEYACHEANYGMTNLLKGARFFEQEAAKPGSTGAK